MLLALIALVAGLVSPAAAATPEAVPLNMGFYLPAIRDANPTDLKISLTVWAEEIAKPFGVRIHTSTYEDLTAMRQALDRAELNFINAPGMELAELFAPGDIRQGYARRRHGIDEGLVLVVAKSSGLRQFADLRGKRVARLSDDRLAEVFLETQCLKVARLDCADLLVIRDEKKDIQSVYSVFFGRADAALVQMATLRIAQELNPQVAERFLPILEWKVPAMFFGMMTRHTDERHRALILDSIKEALKMPRGRQMLELFKTDYLEPVDADAIQPYRVLLQDYNALRKARGRRGK